MLSFFSKKDQNPKLYACLKKEKGPTHPIFTREKNRALLDSRVCCVCVCVCFRFRTQKRNERQRRQRRRMATQHERDALFNALFRKKGNKLCFDCNTPNPKWTSKTFCVFVCLDCSGVHRSLGVHISAVKSANMDRWTTEELDTFKASGGNDAARAFFSQHGWNSNERGKR